MTLLHLLVPLLSLGAVELQTSNMTREVLRNKTFTDGNYILGSRNETFNLMQVERRQLEDRLEGRTGNETSDVMAEDDEGFQQQETKFSGTMCHQDQLEESVEFCGQKFDHAMLFIKPEDRCVLRDVIGPYNEMAECLERLSQILHCFYPNPYTQNFFVAMHSEYFSQCTVEEEHEEIEIIDEKIMITLILVPVGIVPILVYMVIRNSKVQE